MLQLEPNMLNTIYVTSNMHLNYNLGIRPNGHSSPQKISSLCEGVDSIFRIPKFTPLIF